MRIARITASAVVAALFALPLALSACGGDDGEEEGFDTLQACYDDHHGEEHLSVQQAVVVCCLDHPIKGVHPSCGAAKADCVTHVNAEIAGLVAADVDAACTTYINEM